MLAIVGKVSQSINTSTRHTDQPVNNEHKCYRFVHVHMWKVTYRFMTSELEIRL